jgi:antitoxin component YwqK of YwqJK toxin-antitoxin module
MYGIKVKGRRKMFSRLKYPEFNIPLISFVITLLIFGCTKTPEPRDEIVIKDNMIYKPGASIPFTGTIKDTIDGKIIEYAVVDGKKNGIFMMYFPNGQLEMKGMIKDNLNEDTWIYYYQSGQIETEGSFKQDLPEGKWKWYYENGKLKEEGNFVAGNREGEWIIYDIDGSIKEIKRVKNNRVID